MKSRFIVLGGALALACGGGGGPSETPVRKESPADEVGRIGHEWKATTADQKLMSPPSPLSMQRSQRESTLTLTAQSVREDFVVSEELELRTGQHVHCQTTFSHALKARWGRKNGEAAVELIRPQLQATRNCDGPHPEPVLAEPARRALLVLRSDVLQVVEPATDKRQYLPVSN